MVEAFLSPEVMQEIRSLPRDEVLDLLMTAVEVADESVFEAKARFVSAALIMGDIRSENRKRLESSYVQEAFKEYQFFVLKHESLLSLYEELRQGQVRARKHPLRNKGVSLIQLLPEDTRGDV